MGHLRPQRQAAQTAEAHAWQKAQAENNPQHRAILSLRHRDALQKLEALTPAQPKPAQN